MLKAARKTLIREEHGRTTAKRHVDLKAGRQFSRKRKEIKKVARRRNTGGSSPGAKADLLGQARECGIPGRPKLSKPEPERALR